MAGGIFKRGLSDGFLDALDAEAQRGSWWADVLADKGLLIAVRNESFNVYWQGQSLFHVKPNGRGLKATMHPKFLLNPATKGDVSFDGKMFDVAKLSATGFIHTYDGPQTLSDMKTAAGYYAGLEKIGVHTISIRDDAVVDIEIAMSTLSMDFASAEGPDVGNAPRIDIVAFKEKEGEPHLMFWEAKHFSNTGLRATGADVGVVRQIRKYQVVLAHHREDLLPVYTRVARNLVRLADMSRGHRQVAPIVRDVAEGRRELRLDGTGSVGIVIFGYDRAQKAAPAWKAHLAKLEELGKDSVRTAGDAKYISL